MGASYGSGLMDFVADEVESVEEKVEFLKRFAALGLTPRFNEVVDGRVLSVTHEDGRVTTAWLSDEEAAPVLAAKDGYNGSSSARSLPDCLDAQLYVPGCREESGCVELEDSAIDGWDFVPLDGAIEGLKRWVGLLEAGEIEGDLSLTRGLLGQFERCREHRLIYAIEY